MAIRQNPNQGDQANRDSFVDQASAADTTRLHCWIPSGLHHRFKVLALEDRTTMAALVTEAMKNYLAEREG
jgi:hypothetical protein